MRKSTKLVALAVLFACAPGGASAWAAPASDARPVVTAPAPAPAPAAGPSIRASVEALRHASLPPLRQRAERAAAPAQSGGERRLSSAAKAAIWIGAGTVAGIWAYKTFSVTRGTD